MVRGRSALGCTACAEQVHVALGAIAGDARGRSWRGFCPFQEFAFGKSAGER